MEERTNAEQLGEVDRLLLSVDYSEFDEELQNHKAKGKQDKGIDVRPCSQQPLRLTLTDERELHVDGRQVPVPRGIGSRITGAALKALANVYRGFTLYLSDRGTLTRVRDKDVVELLPATEMVSRDDRPQRAVTRPWFGTD